MPERLESYKQAVVLALLLGVLGCLAVSCGKRSVSVTGVVLEHNPDPRKRSPLAGVQITAQIGSRSIAGQTDSSGYFSLKVDGWIRAGQPLHLEFRHPRYQPLVVDATISDNLYIEEMTSLSSNLQPKPGQPITSIANVRIRYSMKNTEPVNVGSAVKTFEVT